MVIVLSSVIGKLAEKTLNDWPLQLSDYRCSITTD